MVVWKLQKMSFNKLIKNLLKKWHKLKNSKDENIYLNNTENVNLTVVIKKVRMVMKIIQNDHIVLNIN